MFVSKTYFAFFLFTIKSRFESVYLAFVFVETVSYAFDRRSFIFYVASMIPDAILKDLTLLACFELYESLLLINGLALLLNLIFKVLLSILAVFFFLLLCVVLSWGILRLFLVLRGALG